MFSISLHINIPDFDRIPIEIDCPICGLHTWVTIGEVRRRDFTICRGCHANIMLEDHLGSVHRSFRNIQHTLETFGR